MSVRVLPEVTLPDGPQTVAVGGRTFRIPASAGVRQGTNPGIVYVLYGAKVHALSNAGEIQIPVELRPRIVTAYFRTKR